MCDAHSSPQAPDAGDFNAAYQLMTRLCELGARPQIVRDMVPDVIKRPMIHATWQTIHGRKSVNGPLPQCIAACMPTALHRLHVTAMLLQIEREQDRPLVERTISVFEYYSRAMGAERLFDFNRTWLIVRAEDSGRIGLCRCPACGTRFAFEPTSAGDALNCPACAMAAPPSKLRAREFPVVEPEASALDAAGGEAASEGGFHEAYQLMVRLCELGARPPVVRDLVPDVIRQTMIYSVWQSINGRTPPQGQLPQSLEKTLASPLARFHTTAILIELERNHHPSLAERMIWAYRRYVEMMGEEQILDFNRVWFIARVNKGGRLRLARCRCGTRFACDHHNALDAKACPACSIRVRAASRTAAPALSAPGAGQGRQRSESAQTAASR